jgi:hypothetical protein
MFIPLSHAAGEAQPNLGEAIVVIPTFELTAHFSSCAATEVALRNQPVVSIMA